VNGRTVLGRKGVEGLKIKAVEEEAWFFPLAGVGTRIEMSASFNQLPSEYGIERSRWRLPIWEACWIG